MADNWDTPPPDLAERRRLSDYTTAVELKGINTTLAEIKEDIKKVEQHDRQILDLQYQFAAGDYEPSNCRWTNATVQAENQWLRKDNSTGYKGVSLDKRNMTYKVQIQINKVKVFIGRFKTDIEAALAFDSYVDKIGSNHRKNFV